MNSTTAVLILSSSYFALATSCAMPALEATPAIGAFEVEGSMGIATGTTPGANDIRVAGLNASESGGGGRVDFKWGLPHMTISSNLTHHQGMGVTQAPLSDGLTAIAAGTNVSTDLGLGIHEGILTFDLIPGSAELGIGFGVAGVDVDGEFVNSGTGEVVASDKLVGIPLLAARAGIGIGRFGIEGLLSGMDADIDGNATRFVDLDLQGRIRLFGGDDHLNGAIVLGYRRVEMDLEYDDDSEQVLTDIDLTGPYLGLRLSL